MKSPSFWLLFVLFCALSTLAILAGGGSLAVALAPLLAAATVYAMWRLPLRYVTLTLTFFALTLENPSDSPAVGRWMSPLYPLGTLLLAHLNLTFPSQKWMFFSGVDLILLIMLLIAAVRWGRRPATLRSAAENAGPMRLFAGVSVAGACFMWLWGYVQGGSDIASSLWQMQRVVYLPVFCVLFQLTLRGHRDRLALAKVVIAAAAVKAMVAIYVVATVLPLPPATVLDYATTHADSMLFATAFCVVVAILMDAPSRGWLKLAAIILPLLAAGMVANHRRIVWVETAAGLVAIYALMRRGRVKRFIARALAFASPLAALYVIVGWGSPSKVFGPVSILRSIVDSKADGSTEWRDWENYNLFFTIKQSPIFGTGYGHGYIETVKLPDISQAYSLYRFIPHNSILGLLAYGGIVGFTALTAMVFVGVYLAVRSVRCATRDADRAAAISAAATIVVYLVHCYGDMGLGAWTSIFTAGPALAVASQLAVVTGAWRGRATGRPKPSVAPALLAAQAGPQPRCREGVAA